MSDPSATVQVLQVVTNLSELVGVITLVTLAIKFTRFITQRELKLDNKLDGIHGDVLLTRNNHLEHVQSAIDRNAAKAEAAHLEVLREVRDSNRQVIDAVRDSGDKIVQAIITLKT